MTVKSRVIEQSQEELKKLGIFALAQGGEGALALALGGMSGLPGSTGLSGNTGLSNNTGMSSDITTPAPAILLLQQHLQGLAASAAKEECKNCLHKLDLDVSLANQTEYFMKQINIMAEAIRMETVTSTREEVLRTDRKVDQLNDSLRDLV